MYVINGKGSIARLLAGVIILISVIISVTISINFLYITAFVGAMLVLSSLLGYCPVELILRSLGIKEKKLID